MINFDIARENMIESQVRPNGITDNRVIAAMAEIAREAFVPEGQRGLAYMDEDIVVSTNAGSEDRALMEPMAFARLVQLAAVKQGDFVLDIGCASGYSAAVLAHLAQSVVAIDESETLCETASANHDSMEISNIAVLQGAHAVGCPAEAPFDVVILEGRVPAVPQSLLDQLKDGGRLVAVVGNDTVAQAQLWIRQGDAFSSRNEFSATIAPLPGIEVERPAFTF